MERKYNARATDLRRFLLSMSAGDFTIISWSKHSPIVVRNACVQIKKKGLGVYTTTEKDVKRGIKVTRLA